MFKDSVIHKTGQWWKLIAGVLALIGGSVIPLFEASGMSWTVGTIISVVGYGFVLAFISCPDCGQRWFWRALLYSEIYGPLFKKAACPNCEKVFE
jgi:hypothetical protein